MTPTRPPSYRQTHARCFRGIESWSVPVRYYETAPTRLRGPRSSRYGHGSGGRGGTLHPEVSLGDPRRATKKVCPPWKCGANIAGILRVVRHERNARSSHVVLREATTCANHGHPPLGDRAPVASPARPLFTRGSGAKRPHRSGTEPLAQGRPNPQANRGTRDRRNNRRHTTMAGAASYRIIRSSPYPYRSLVRLLRWGSHCCSCCTCLYPAEGRRRTR